MLRLTRIEPVDTRARPAVLRAGLVSLRCLLRGLPLLFRAAPGTPLRVMCIVALDTIYLLRNAQPLSRQRRAELATFLDFQACTNAAWDRKHLCVEQYQALRQQLENAGLEPWMTEYLRRLHELETRRPSIGGDLRRFDDVRSYREAVVRLSLAAVTAIALNAECVEDGVRATYCDGDVAALFQMAMQCQIIDDVIDYAQDLSMGLPSFLTASGSLRQGMASTGEASRFYGASSSAGRAVFPLEAALCVLTMAAKLVLAVAGKGQRRNAVAVARHARR